MTTSSLVLTALLSAAALAAPLDTAAQTAGEARKIGYIGANAGPDKADRAFGEALRALGWTEQTLATESRWAHGDGSTMEAHARELVRRNVELLVILSTSVRAYDTAVYAGGTAPVVVSLTDVRMLPGLARPGARITGPTFMSTDLHAKRLELLRDIVPGVSRVAVLSRQGAFAAYEPRIGAAALGIALQRVDVGDPAELDTAFAAMRRERVGGVLVASDDLFLVHRRQVAGLAAATRLPAVYELREYVEAGGLMSYGPSLPDIARKAAGYVDRILRGARPADLPVDQPTKFELVINLRAAKALGLTVPQAVLARADELIQ